VLSGIGFALGFLAAVWLGFAIFAAAYVPGHWGDVVRIAGVCVVPGVTSIALIRIGRRG
jgi:hypothetical protein